LERCTFRTGDVDKDSWLPIRGACSKAYFDALVSGFNRGMADGS
jgi:hypothetical protein